MSYETYLANGYHNRGPCIPIPPTVLSPFCNAKGNASGLVKTVYRLDPFCNAKGTARDIGQPYPLGLCEGKGNAIAGVGNVWKSFPVGNGKVTCIEGPPQALSYGEGKAIVVLDPSQELTYCDGKGAAFDVI